MVEYGDFAKESDLCKWMEAAAYSLADFKDEKLENVMDELSDLFAKAQADDGYLNTYYIAKGEKQRFNCLSEMHELYCAGHLIEAAVAYYNATGKTVLLNAVKNTPIIYAKFSARTAKRRFLRRTRGNRTRACKTV